MKQLALLLMTLLTELALGAFGYTYASGRLWNEGVIPYVIDLNGPGEKRKTRTIQKTIKEWNKRIDVQWVPFDETKHEARAIFQEAAANVARAIVGRDPKKDIQIILLTFVSAETDSAIITHEMGHTAGLEHEHQRPDRDKFIKVNETNLEGDLADDERWKKISIDKIESDDLSTFKTPFDFNSLMLYSSYAFSQGVHPVFTRKTPVDGSNVWGTHPKKQLFSPNDILGLNRMYAPVFKALGIVPRSLRI